MHERVTAELDARLETLSSQADHNRRFIAETEAEIRAAQKRLDECEATIKQMRSALEILLAD